MIFINFSSYSSVKHSEKLLWSSQFNIYTTHARRYAMSRAFSSPKSTGVANKFEQACLQIAPLKLSSTRR